MKATKKMGVGGKPSMNVGKATVAPTAAKAKYGKAVTGKKAMMKKGGAMKKGK